MRLIFNLEVCYCVLMSGFGTRAYYTHGGLTHMEEQIMFGINNITRTCNLIKNMMARNDDFIILGLILKKERNRFTIGWRVRLRYPKHPRNSLLHRFYLMFGFVTKNLCLSLFIFYVRSMYEQLLYVT